MNLFQVTEFLFPLCSTIRIRRTEAGGGTYSSLEMNNLKYCALHLCGFQKYVIKGEAIPVTGRKGPLGCEAVEAPSFSRQSAQR
jgi:hypothetical protein